MMARIGAGENNEKECQREDCLGQDSLEGYGCRPLRGLKGEEVCEDWFLFNHHGNESQSAMIHWKLGCFKNPITGISYNVSISYDSFVEMWLLWDDASWTWLFLCEVSKNHSITRCPAIRYLPTLNCSICWLSWPVVSILVSWRWPYNHKLLNLAIEVPSALMLWTDN